MVSFRGFVVRMLAHGEGGVDYLLLISVSQYPVSVACVQFSVIWQCFFLHIF